MDSCPPPAALDDFLDGRLGERETSRLNDHLLACTPCNRHLQAITDDPVLARWIAGATTGRGDAIGPGSRVGSYLLKAVVGRGGMGVVYRAWDVVVGREVAVKLLAAGGDLRHLERFRREAQATGAIRNDHIVPVYATDQTAAGRPFIVMPLIDGPTLRDRLRAGPLPPRDAADVIRQVADGLAATHAAYLVHRDVKPSNILLDRTDGRAKLTDFGLVRRTSTGLTQEDVIAGTAEYMSPEQAATPDRLDARSDLYSLGATLYECLTGTPPFRGAPLDVISQHRFTEPVCPRQLNRGIPRDLETICLKAMAKEPARRYQDARAVRDDLDRWRRGVPIFARATGPVERSIRWGRRNPVAVALLGVFVAGFVSSALGWRRAAMHADEAAARTRDAEDATLAVAAQRHRAEDHLATAREAIDRLYTRVIDGGLLNEPKHLSQRNELMADSARFYEKMLGREEADNQLRQSAIHTTTKLGDIYVALGRDADAERAHLRAHVLARDFLARNPTTPEAKSALLRATVRLRSFYWNRGQADRAASYDDEAVATAGDLLRLDPDDKYARRNLAAIYANRAGVSFVKGDREAAKRAYSDAFEQFSELARRYPEENVFQMDLARTEFNLGFVGDWTRHWPSAFRQRKTLLDKNPDHGLLNQEYIKNGLYLARAEFDRGQFLDASATAAQVVQVAKRYVKAVSNDISIKHGLAAALFCHAQSLHRLKRNGEAEAAFRESDLVYEELLATDYARFIDELLANSEAYLSCLIDMQRIPQIKSLVDKNMARILERQNRANLSQASRQNYERLHQLLNRWKTP